MEGKVRLGTIELFDPVNKRGVIAPRSKSQDQPSGLYFEVSEDEALGLRVGQLVQFVEEIIDPDIGPEAKRVSVLSEKA